MTRYRDNRRVNRAVAVMAIALLVGCSGGHNGAVRDPQEAVLRVGDMPRGYVEGDDTGCGQASPEEDEKLIALFRKDPADVCEVELERVWAKPTGPPLVTSDAFVFEDADHAKEAFGARFQLVSYGASLWARTEQDVDLGDEGRLLRGRGLNHPAVGVVWRSANVMGELVVEPADERAALMYARRQQRRIEGAAPPPTPTPTNTVEIELDDPSLKLPVYWLGRSFDPGGSLPSLELEAATVLSPGGGPGDTVKLDYLGVANGRTIAARVKRRLTPDRTST